MISVVFKLNKQKGFATEEFSYKSYEGNEVGDIVVVNTRYGYAIAKVVAIDTNDDRFTEEQLSTVVNVIESAEYQRQELKKKDMYNALIKRIKRRRLEDKLKDICIDNDEYELIKAMSDEDLEKFSNAIG